MDIQFTPNIREEEPKVSHVAPRRRWDRWLYIAILVILLGSLLKWLIYPYFFDLSEGVLLQQQYDINFAGVSRGHYNMMLLAGIMEILSATIKEMRVGPSQSVYRNRLQTITSCVLSNQKVVNVVCNKSEDMVRYV